MFLPGWNMKVENSLDIRWVWGDALVGQNMSSVHDRCFGELAFGRFQPKIGTGQPSEDSFKINEMLLE